MNTASTQKSGYWSGGSNIARGSIATLKANKKLVAFPVYATLASVAYVLILISIIYPLSIALGQPLVIIDGTSLSVGSYATAAIFGILLALGIIVINNIGKAVVTYSVVAQFQGNNIATSQSLRRVRSRIVPIIGFSIVQTTIGLLIRVGKDKLPLYEHAALLLADVAWQLATLFAIPVIMLEEQSVNPITAIKKSSSMFAQTWGKNFWGSLGLGAYTFLAFLTWFVVTLLDTQLALIWPMTLIITAPVVLISLLGLISIVSALNSVFTAALYYYATTGESPTVFEKDMLRQAFKPKKKWFA